MIWINASFGQSNGGPRQMMFGTEAILILITGMSVQSLVYIKQSLVTGGGQ